MWSLIIAKSTSDLNYPNLNYTEYWGLVYCTNAKGSFHKGSPRRRHSSKKKKSTSKKG